MTPSFDLTQCNEIITSPHLEVTLDNFGFLVGGRDQRNLAGIPGAPKKWYGGPTEPVPTGITEKRPFLRCPETWKTGRKSVFCYTNPPKYPKRLIFIWEKGTFSFWQLRPVMAGTWLESKSECFFSGQKFRISARKSVFWYGTAFFVNGAFVALAVGSVLALDPSISVASFPSYGRFSPAHPVSR